MKTDNIKRWTNELRVTDLPQAKAMLAVLRVEDSGDSDARPENTVGYCCLGIGCLVAGIDSSKVDRLGLDEQVLIEYLTFDGEDRLAPTSFAAWLGFGWGSDGWMTSKIQTLVLAAPELRLLDGDRLDSPLTILNDNWDLTFPQIADCIDYFGVRLA